MIWQMFKYRVLNYFLPLEKTTAVQQQTADVEIGLSRTQRNAALFHPDGQ